MFSAFFYLLRARGLDISMKEWLTLIEALKLGLHGSSMKGFYNLCLAVLCKSEADYDRFGQAFLEFSTTGKSTMKTARSARSTRSRCWSRCSSR